MADKITKKMEKLDVEEKKEEKRSQSPSKKSNKGKPTQNEKQKKKVNQHEDSDEDLAYMHMVHGGAGMMGPMMPTPPAYHGMPMGPPPPPMGPPPMMMHPSMGHYGPMMPPPHMHGHMHYAGHDAAHKKALEEHEKRMASHHAEIEKMNETNTVSDHPTHPFPMWGPPIPYPGMMGPGMMGPGMMGPSMGHHHGPHGRHQHHGRGGRHGPGRGFGGGRGRRFWRFMLKNGMLPMPDSSSSSSSSSSEDEEKKVEKKQCKDEKKKCWGARKEKKKAWKRAMKNWMMSQNYYGGMMPPCGPQMQFNSEGESTSPDTEEPEDKSSKTQEKNPNVENGEPMEATSGDSDASNSSGPDDEVVSNPMALYHFQMMKHHRQVMRQCLGKGRGMKRGCKGWKRMGQNQEGRFPGGMCAVRKECQAMRQAGCDKETIKEYRQQMRQKLQENRCQWSNDGDNNNSSASYAASMTVDGQEMPAFTACWAGDGAGMSGEGDIMSGSGGNGAEMSRQEWMDQMKEQRKAWRQQCKMMAEEAKKGKESSPKEKNDETFEVV